ncbi:MAG: hypothetical protein K9G46_10900 [Flavobacteriales bacterium]|nr:hypothetical protein [Flavobacteriales bacterium]
MRNLFPLFIFILLSFSALAQDEDYYKEEQQREPITASDLQDLYRWGPKFGIEAFGSVGYSHFYAPSTISAAFTKATGGLGYDAGIGARIRIYHKLAMAFGFQFSGRGYNIGFPAYAEIDTGTAPNTAVATLDIDIAEKANITYLGFYIKPVIEISRKFHLAILFHPSWQLSYKGSSTQIITGGPPSYIGSVGTLQDESSVEIIEEQFELGLEFAYKWVIAPQFIIKPHIGINLATSGIFHTGAEMPTPFGGWEQNPSFMTLRVGVIFEMGIWMDQPKTSAAY